MKSSRRCPKLTPYERARYIPPPSDQAPEPSAVDRLIDGQRIGKMTADEYLRLSRMLTRKRKPQKQRQLRNGLPYKGLDAPVLF